MILILVYFLDLVYIFYIVLNKSPRKRQRKRRNTADFPYR